MMRLPRTRIILARADLPCQFAALLRAVYNRSVGSVREKAGSNRPGAKAASLPQQRKDVASRAKELRWVFLGLMLATTPLLDPSLPLMGVLSRYGLTPEAPVLIYRKNGTLQSRVPVHAALANVADLRGDVVKDDIMTMGAMHSATQLGDLLQQSGLQNENHPIVQFARHFRNASAHGNSWHFRNNEPKQIAELRGRRLSRSDHGARVMFGWMAPGDFLDYLDDLIAWLDHPSGEVLIDLDRGTPVGS